MNNVLSNLLLIASAISFVFVFARLYIIQFRSFTGSMLWALMTAGAFFAMSAFFDRRQARIYNHSPTRLLPSRRGFFSFLVYVYFLLTLAVFFGTTIYTALQLPSGDDWGTAWLRLVYCVAVLLFGCLFHSLAVRLGDYLFAGRAHDDIMESLGKPSAASANTRQTNGSLAMTDALVSLSAGILVLLGAMEWLASIDTLQAVVRRNRAMQFYFQWCLDHPNTVNLFAMAVCCISGASIAWRLSLWYAKRRLGEGVEYE